MRFTDAHSTSAACTPSRYSLLTGEYAWRRKGTGILRGNAPLIIEPGRTTLASVLKRAGYATPAVGKWHLGLGGHDQAIVNGFSRIGHMSDGRRALWVDEDMADTGKTRNLRAEQTARTDEMTRAIEAVRQAAEKSR